MEYKFNFQKLPLVQWASGTVSFSGEGYWYHKFLKMIPGFTRKGITDVMKTVTLVGRVGNTPLNPLNFQPKELFPKSIWINWVQGSPVNAVGLTNFGIKVHLRGWVNQKDPFYVSIMAVGEEGKKVVTISEKIAEVALMVDSIIRNISLMPMLAGVQINLSCGNTGHDQQLDIEEIIKSLDVCIRLHDLGLHVIPKITADTPIEAIKKISEHPAVTAIALSNAIQYDKFSDNEKINHGFSYSEYVDGPDNYEDKVLKLVPMKSKLLNRGIGISGSVSGDMLFVRVLKLLKEIEPFRNDLKPLIIGGGITSVNKLDQLVPYLRRGDKIALGSVIFLRPWRISAIKQRLESLNLNKTLV